MARLEKGVNDLATVNPKLASEWHPTKNIGLKNKKGEDISTPDKNFAGSNKKVWWKLPYDVPMDYPIKHLRGRHYDFEWEATIYNRKKGSGCPYLSGQAVWPSFNDLETINPELATQWHPTKNGDLKPSNIGPGSKYKAWWICEHGHEWQSAVYSRNSGYGCPVCNRLKRISFPEQVIYYYVKKYFPDSMTNNKTALDGKELDVYIPSLKTGIEYDGVFYHQNTEKDIKKNKTAFSKGVSLIRIREFGCPVLVDDFVKYIIRKNDRIESLEEVVNALLSHLNIKSSPVNIHKDYFEILNQVKLCENQSSLEMAYPTIAKQWHQTLNGNLKPSDVKKGNNIRVWWQCEHGHVWDATVNSRTKGAGCPYCAGKCAIRYETDLQTVNPELAAQWHPTKNIGLTDRFGRNISTPDKITAGSNQKIWWLCTHGHEWQATVHNRTNGRGCPQCYKNKCLSKNNFLISS